MKVKFYTLGCKVNQYESGALAELFEKAGFEVTLSGVADIYVINSCTVTAAADSKSRNLVRRAKRLNPQAVTVFTGCLTSASPDDAAKLGADVVCGNNDRGRTVDLVKEYLKSSQAVSRVTPHSPHEVFEELSVSRFGERTRAYVKIEDGCDRCCAYCIIPQARGPVRSKALGKIGAELEGLALNGYKEIVLTGVNLTSFGMDTGASIVDAVLLAESLPGIERVRLGSLEPDLISPAMIERLSESKKLCPQFHLSLQSGCDATLARMKRRYDTQGYLDLVRKIRECFPGAGITTDMMVGFPGESREEFALSMEFAREIGFAKTHVFAYSKRRNTAAATMPGQIPADVKSERSRLLMAQAEKQRMKFLALQIGKTCPVLFESESVPGISSGFTPNYSPVSVKSQTGLKGEIRPVRITGLEEDTLVGELV